MYVQTYQCKYISDRLRGQELQSLFSTFVKNTHGSKIHYKSRSDKFPDHREVWSFFELEYTSHATHVLGSNGNGWAWGFGLNGGRWWSIAGHRGGRLMRSLFSVKF
jgi:hypothetical protein